MLLRMRTSRYLPNGSYEIALAASGMDNYWLAPVYMFLILM